MEQILLETEHSKLVKVQGKKYESLVDKCVDEINNLLNVKPEIVIMGKKCNQKRNIGFFSDISEGYKYSGQISKSIPLTKSLKKLLKKINKKFMANFNGILINEYENGNDYIGQHSDDIQYLDPNMGVVALSYGAIRIFRIKGKNTNYKKDIKVRHLDIIIMNGDFQKEFTHGIPIESKICDSRISFTFRCHSK